VQLDEKIGLNEKSVIIDKNGKERA